MLLRDLCKSKEVQFLAVPAVMEARSYSSGLCPVWRADGALAESLHVNTPGSGPLTFLYRQRSDSKEIKAGAAHL